MHAATYTAFRNELEKIAIAGHLAEIGGLGILAAPTASKHFGGKEWSDKNKRRAELAGLGVLAAPSAVGLAKDLGKRFIKRGSVSKTSSVVRQASTALEPIMKRTVTAAEVMGTHRPPGMTLQQIAAARKARLGLGKVKLNSIQKEALGWSDVKAVGSAVIKPLKNLVSSAPKVAPKVAPAPIKTTFQGGTHALNAAATGRQINQAGVVQKKVMDPRTGLYRKERSLDVGLT